MIISQKEILNSIKNKNNFESLNISSKKTNLLSKGKYYYQNQFAILQLKFVN